MSDASANFLNVHEWAYGVTEVAHIGSLAIAIGFIAVVDLRLLNQGIVHATPARLLRATAIGTLIGLVVAITTGFMIFSTDPARYFAHPAMRLKLVLLLVALAFNYTVHSQHRGQLRACIPPIARGATTDPTAAPMIVWTVSAAEGIAGPPTGARSKAGRGRAGEYRRRPRDHDPARAAILMV